MATTVDIEEEDDVLVHDDLAALVRVEGARLASDERLRAYRVIVGPERKRVTKYVVTHSPANAALAVCDVDRVPLKEMNRVLMAVVGERAPSLASMGVVPEGELPGEGD
jgi:hypothetical protein